MRWTGSASVGLADAVRDDLRVLIGKGAPWILLLVAAQAIASIAIPSVPFLAGEQSRFVLLDQQRKAAFAGLTPLEELATIFKDNLLEAYTQLIPIVGAVPLTSATYDTARIVQVDAIAANAQPSLYTGYFFLFPHAWVELAGYAIAVFQGFRIAGLFRRAGSRGFARSLMAHAVSSVVIVTLVILVAAAFEEGEIVMGPLRVLAWIPLAAIAIAVVWGRRASLGATT